jgi:hypothetical protein
VSGFTAIPASAGAFCLNYVQVRPDAGGESRLGGAVPDVVADAGGELRLGGAVPDVVADREDRGALGSRARPRASVTGCDAGNIRDQAALDTLVM